MILYLLAAILALHVGSEVLGENSSQVSKQQRLDQRTESPVSRGRPSLDKISILPGGPVSKASFRERRLEPCTRNRYGTRIVADLSDPEQAEIQASEKQESNSDQGADSHAP